MTTAPQNYPLAWPEGWERTPMSKRRSAGRYRVSLSRAIGDAVDSAYKLGALQGSVVLSTNVQPSLVRETIRDERVKDAGISLWWTTRAHGQRVIACDKWDTVLGNVRAAGLALEALRAIERAGATQVLDRAFTAFGALPAGGGGVPKRPWWDVLGFPHELIGALSVAVTDARYRELAKQAHPDVGGTKEGVLELTRARDEARAHYENG